MITLVLCTKLAGRRVYLRTDFQKPYCHKNCSKMSFILRVHQVACVFLCCIMLSDEQTLAGPRMTGFDRFNYKPRKTQVSNISPQALKLYGHPWGAKIIRASNFEIEFEIGRKIVLVCTAQGNPLPNLIWFKDGIELYAHKWVIISEWVYGDHRQTKSSKMEIHPATTMDRGEYECLAENKYSIDRRRFRTEYLD